jgi:predicted secreted Zn-dependent protease
LRIPRPSIDHFRVQGSTLDELNDALNRHRWWGRYRAFPDVDRRRDDPLVSLEISARPVIYLPEWREKSAAPRPIQQEWDRMIAVLTRHEEHHHEIFMDAVTAFAREVEDYGDPLPRRTFTRMWQRFNADTQREQNSYDSRTAHGQREGVALNDP